jgi:endogenous inhibitor of DNA gyrase (YacG/DUF329 family)
MSQTENITPLRKPVPCPQCSKPSARETYPFCSKRCSDLDLGAWLNGNYAIGSTNEDTNSQD